MENIKQLGSFVEPTSSNCSYDPKVQKTAVMILFINPLPRLLVRVLDTWLCTGLLARVLVPYHLHAHRRVGFLGLQYFFWISPIFHITENSQKCYLKFSFFFLIQFVLQKKMINNLVFPLLFTNDFIDLNLHYNMEMTTDTVVKLNWIARTDEYFEVDYHYNLHFSQLRFRILHVNPQY